MLKYNIKASIFVFINILIIICKCDNVKDWPDTVKREFECEYLMEKLECHRWGIKCSWCFRCADGRADHCVTRSRVNLYHCEIRGCQTGLPIGLAKFKPVKQARYLFAGGNRALPALEPKNPNWADVW